MSPPDVLAAAAETHTSSVFVELGLVVLGLASLARVALAAGFSPIPLYLVAGLVFGQGGVVPLDFSEDFIGLGAQIGVILLLFMLGLEYTAEELRTSLRTGLPAGLVDLALNATPGLAAGMLLGWSPLASLLLAGITAISSSGIVAKLLADLDQLGNRETPSVLTVLVLEDLAMAVYLPLVAVLLVGGSLTSAAGALGIALATVAVVLLVALRFGEQVSAAVASRSDEVVLLTVFGLVLLVAGAAEQLQVSSAVGAFLLGIALSGSVAERSRRLLGPLRDLFAATFFFFFGLQVDPSGLPGIAVPVLLLGLASAVTKMASGWWAARRQGVRTRGRFRAGALLVSRGEFSIVVAGLGVAAGVEPQLAPLAAGYVLLMAVAGPVLARITDPVVVAVQRRAAAAA